MSEIIFHNFKDFDDLKRRSEFFKKGSIVPTRIFSLKKGLKKRGRNKTYRHGNRITFGSNFYLVRILNRHVLFSFDDDRYAFAITRMHNVDIRGNPYGEGDCHWVFVKDWEDFEETIKRVTLRIYEERNNPRSKRTLLVGDE